MPDIYGQMYKKVAAHGRSEAAKAMGAKQFSGRYNGGYPKPEASGNRAPQSSPKVPLGSNSHYRSY